MNYINNKNTKEEQELINEFNLVKAKYINNKIAKHIIENNEKLNELFKAIKEKTKSICEYGIKYNYPTRTRKLLDDSKKLEKEIIDFKLEEYKMDYSDENNLVDKCLFILSNETLSIPAYFDEFIARRQFDLITNREYKLNEKLIEKVYGYIQKEGLIDELEKGTRITTNKNKYENKVDKCNVALSYKEIIEKNSDLIIEFNKTVRDINNIIEEKNNDKYLGLIPREKSNSETIEKLESNNVIKIINKNKLEKLYKEKEKLLKLKKEYERIDNELMRLHIKLGKININLKEEDLSDLVTRSDLKYLLNKELDPIAITSNLKHFYSKEDIDNYYKYIEEQYVINKFLLEDTLKEEQEFNSKASEDAKELIKNNFLTAEALGNLNKKNDKNIDPKLAIYILKSIIDIKKTKVEDLDITEEEYIALKAYYDCKINEKIVEISEKLNEIENPRRHR